MKFQTHKIKVNSIFLTKFQWSLYIQLDGESSWIFYYIIPAFRYIHVLVSSNKSISRYVQDEWYYICMYSFKGAPFR
jgi:hypothetical protein